MEEELFFMKIEKLTENKIRVILNAEELGVSNVNMHTLMTKALEKKDIFSDILEKAQKDLDFRTDGCKLLIEAFASLDDLFVFTITRFLPEPNAKKRRLLLKGSLLVPFLNMLFVVLKHLMCFVIFAKLLAIYIAFILID